MPFAYLVGQLSISIHVSKVDQELVQNLLLTHLAILDFGVQFAIIDTPSLEDGLTSDHQSL